VFRLANKYLFDVKTPLGYSVHCSSTYWEFVSTVKHPSLDGHREEVEMALRDPSEIRQSRKDINVHLFYRGEHPRWICAVAKQEDGTGFLITAYLTDSIKVGDLLWTKSK
jgi:hypothetical protein